MGVDVKQQAAAEWTEEGVHFFGALLHAIVIHILDRDVQVGHDSVHLVQSARDLGVYVDGGMMMRAHINHVLWSCYGTLRQLRSIKWSLPSHALNTLVTGLLHSQLDYCNVVFFWSSSLRRSMSAVHS